MVGANDYGIKSPFLFLALGDVGLNFPGDFRWGRGAIGRREFQALIFSGIMAGSHVDAAQGFAGADSVADDRRGRVAFAEEHLEAIGLQHLGGSQREFRAKETGVMTNDDLVGLKLAPLRFQVIGNALCGDADAGKGEVTRNEAAPTGGAKLDGGQGIAHGSLSFPVESLFLHSINVADEEDAKKGDHAAEDQCGMCGEHVLIDNSPRKEEHNLDVK